MSKIGRQLIDLALVQVKLENNFIIVKGPKGELKQKLHPNVRLEIKGQSLLVSVLDPEDKFDRALWGLYRSLINNMVLGVKTGFTKQLEINGVGFKAQVAGDKLILNVGFSHPVELIVPAGIEIKVADNKLTVSGIDKQAVGETAAKIRAIKPPEPYKGKGIKYADETIRRKAGKVMKGEAGTG